MPLTVDFVANYSAPTDGTSDAGAAWRNFRTDARLATGLVTITVPANTYQFLSDDGSGGTRLASGIDNLLVVSTGGSAIFTDNSGAGSGYTLGAFGGFSKDNLHSARLYTISAGASSVRLKDISKAALFSVGDIAMIAGIDLQGSGDPINPHFMEYIQITDITSDVITFQVAHVNSTTHILSFTSSGLANTYKDTWPLYNAGDAVTADYGGPATIYALSQDDWNIDVEYQGITFSRGATQILTKAKSITLTDCIVTGGGGVIPTECIKYKIHNSDLSACDLEMDKIVDTAIFSGTTTVDRVAFQSSSTNNMYVQDTTSITTLEGQPKNLYVSSGVSIGTWKPGCTKYGASIGVCELTSCAVTTLDTNGGAQNPIVDTGSPTGNTMASGVITMPGGPFDFIPGGVYFWSGSKETFGGFRVTDVTYDGVNTYVYTTWSGGFPSSHYLGGTQLFVRAHPCPSITCRSVSGDSRLVDCNSAPAGLPLYSWARHTYTGSTIGNSGATTTFSRMWGKLSSLKVTVDTPYSGSATYHPLGIFDNYTTIKLSDGSDYTFAPIYDLNTAGTRTITPSVPGTPLSGSDSNLSVPEAVWFPEPGGGGASTDLSAQTVQVTVEIITDQGFAPLAVVPFRLRLHS